MFNGEDDAIGATSGFAGAGGGGQRPGGRGAGRFQQADFATTNPDFYFYDLNGKITYRPSFDDVLSIGF